MRLLSLLVLGAGIACAQSAQPDCQYTLVFTSNTAQSPAFSNKPTTSTGPACVSWSVAYWTNNASSVSVQIEGAPDSSGSPGSYTKLTAATSPITSSNPATGTNEGVILACCDYYPWIRINPTTLSGASVTMTVRVYGYKTPTQIAGGGGGGGGGGTGNAASIVTYTPGSSVTLTCPSSSADTVTAFNPASSAALSANMAISFASCTPGQTVTLLVIQASSGGPYTLSGLPTGSPQMSSYAGVSTQYTFAAASATAMNFVGVSAWSGPGISTDLVSAPAAPGNSGTTAVYTRAGVLCWIPNGGAETCGIGSGSVIWNTINNPTGNQSLSMGTYTTRWTWSAATGSAVSLFTLTDTASNTGTGALEHLTTASGSAAYPWQADANGAGFEIGNPGQLQQVGSVAFSANYGSVSVGRGPFDGATTGHFAGSSSGNSIAVNESSGYTGYLIDLQVAGAEYFSIRNNGNTYVRNALLVDTAGTEYIWSAAGLITTANVALTSAAPTVSANQIGYGSTTAAASNCGVISATACIVVNIGGTTHYVPYF